MVQMFKVMILFICGVLFSCTWGHVNSNSAPVSLKTDDMSGVQKEMDGVDNHETPILERVDGPLKLTIENVGMIALSNNRSLNVKRLLPEIEKTYEGEEKGHFDTVLKANASVNRNHTADDRDTDTYEESLSLEKFFPGGTTITIDTRAKATEVSFADDSLYEAEFGITLTQALLKGFGRKTSLVRLEKARLSTRMSEFEVRGFSEAVLSQAENAYWDYALALRQMEIVKESLNLVTRQLKETEEMIEVGTMAEVERVSVQAEAALQKQGLINAKSTLDMARLRLIRILNVGGENFWDRKLVLLHPPKIPDIQLGDVNNHVSLALKMRPEINQAKLNMKRQQLEVLYTKNGVLPKMDLFLSLGKTGYADSFGSAVEEISNEAYEVMGGLTFEYPVANSSAKSRRRRSELNAVQAEKALENLTQLVELDVRSAYIKVIRTKEQIQAGLATRRLQEEKLRIETEKFRVGRSTNYLVSQAQRDLLVAKISEVQSLINHIQSTIDLFRLEGSLLMRRNIEAPGVKLK